MPTAYLNSNFNRNLYTCRAVLDTDLRVPMSYSVWSLCCVYIGLDLDG